MTDSYDPADAAADEPLPARGYRTYEVFQRERVGETTNLLSPRELIGDEYLSDPRRLLTILREHYPCYRDWVGNRFWITRYDDVTSVLADTANYETRPPSSSYPSISNARSLWDELDFGWALERRVDAGLDSAIDQVLTAVAEVPDLATSFAARLPIELWGNALDLTGEALREFATLFWQLKRGVRWDPIAHRDGEAAAATLIARFEDLLAQRAGGDGDDLISVAASLDASGHDLVVSLVDADHETLHGGLANLWFQLLTNPDQLAMVRDDPRMMKFAWLEGLRHSPAVIHAERYARREVERFGRLLPDGALLMCSTAAANRDPRVFDEPDEFRVDRPDLCQREPRGQYRADGLASGIAIGLGLPSVQPAVPREGPRSLYALTRDVAVRASQALLEAHPTITLEAGSSPRMRSLRLGEMVTCWSLPVALAD